MVKSTTAALIVIGDEILSGRTQDQNLAYLAAWLNERGVALQEARVIPDDPDTICETVRTMKDMFDYVFTTGGIGPTHDDITAENVARAFDRSFVMNEKAKQLLLEHYGDKKITDARLRMACMPEGAQLIDNIVSGAPGFQVENVFVMAGIPKIMQAMLDSLGDRIKGTRRLYSVAVTAFGGESTMAATLQDVQDSFEGVTIGSYPFFRKSGGGACLIARSPDKAQLEDVKKALKEKISALGIEVRDGEPDSS